LFSYTRTAEYEPYGHPTPEEIGSNKKHSALVQAASELEQLQRQSTGFHCVDSPDTSLFLKTVRSSGMSTKDTPSVVVIPDSDVRFQSSNSEANLEMRGFENSFPPAHYRLNEDTTLCRPPITSVSQFFRNDGYLMTFFDFPAEFFSLGVVSEAGTCVRSSH